MVAKLGISNIIIIYCMQTRREQKASERAHAGTRNPVDTNTIANTGGFDRHLSTPKMPRSTTRKKGYQQDSCGEEKKSHSYTEKAESNSCDGKEGGKKNSLDTQDGKQKEGCIQEQGVFTQEDCFKEKNCSLKRQNAERA